MKVSVILLCYNQKDSVAMAIDSVLAQKCGFSYEILVSDDASTDGTREICEMYAKKFPDKIRFFAREQNLGIQKNYFYTLSEAKGEYIADCAGDDSWHGESRLEKLACVLDSYRNVSLVHSAWFDISDKAKSLHDSPLAGKRISRRGSLVLPLLRHDASPLIHLSSSLYRREILTDDFDKDPDIYLNPKYKCEDLQILTLMADKGDIFYLPEPTLNYTVGQSSVSHQFNPGRAFDYFRSTLLLTEALARKFGVNDSLLRRYYSDRINYLISLAFAVKSDLLMREALQLKREKKINLTFKSLVKLLIIKLRK